jgi:hypothetical protein
MKVTTTTVAVAAGIAAGTDGVMDLPTKQSKAQKMRTRAILSAAILAVLLTGCVSYHREEERHPYYYGGGYDSGYYSSGQCWNCGKTW